MIDSVVGAGTDTVGWLNPAVLFGLVVLLGTFGARLFQKLHIPQVVGCVAVGIILGDVLDLVTPAAIESLQPFTMFALGVIGFMIGAELRLEVFKKYGRQFFIILFSQGIGAFLLVAVGSSVVAASLFFKDNLAASIGIGLVLGAIASATAPAATVNVLWEYKTRGPLTAAILAIVALDDALALLLYRGAATAAKALCGTGDDSVMKSMLVLFGEIVGAILLGFLFAVLLHYLLKIVRAEDKILGFSIGSLLLVVGISIILEIGPILPAMTLGITMANLAPRRSKGAFNLVKGFSPPIYTAFFVLAGAHMQFSLIAGWMVVMVVVYTIGRAAGKIVGCWFGAKLGDAPTVVRKYLGICLLPQAGVAIGLAILAGQQFKFNPEIGHAIIMVTMTATFLMEVFGPMLVKLGVQKAGEVGMNVTEDDLIKTYTVKDVMDASAPTIAQDLPLEQILEVFSTTKSVCYPVIDAERQIIGLITIGGIKEMFANRDVAGWLLACDVAGPVLDKTTADKPLQDALETMRRYDLENMPVVAGPDSNLLAGMLDARMVNRKISAEVLHRRRKADEMAPATG
jgi:Kef-type K+ transport system membrane component KefB